MHRLDVLLEIWRTRERIAAHLAHVLLAIGVNLFDMRIHIRLCCEHFRAETACECLVCWNSV